MDDAQPNPRRTMAVGALLVALIAGLIGFAFRANAGFPVGDSSYADLAFADVGPLLEGDDVRIGSLRVGRVERIALKQDRAVVSIKLDGSRPVYRDATAKTMSRSGLGQKFVELNPGTPAAGLLGGGVLPPSRTSTVNELDTLLDVFDRPTRDALGTSVRSLGTGVAGHAPDLQDALKAAPGMLPDIGDTSASLASRQADLPGLLNSARTLTGRFTGQERDVARLVDQLGTTIQAVAADGGVPLGQSLKALPDTLVRADRAFDALDRPLGDTAVALHDLDPGAGALGQATPDVRGVLREAVVPLSKVPDVSQQADPALVDLTRTVRELRPLAPPLVRALDRSRTPLEVLSPYHRDISQFFTDSSSSLSQGVGNEHWLRLLVVPRTGDLLGTVGPGLPDASVNRNAYPAPGQARAQRAATPTGSP